MTKPPAHDFLGIALAASTIFDDSARENTNHFMRHRAGDPILVNCNSDDEFHPLGIASFLGKHETVGYLVKAGTSLNSPSNNLLDATSLQSVIASGHAQIVVQILENHADLDPRESNDYTPRHKREI